MRPKSFKSAKLFLRYFKYQDLDNFMRKNERKTENAVFVVVLHKLKNNRLCDIRNDKCTIQQETVSNVSVCGPDMNITFYGSIV